MSKLKPCPRCGKDEGTIRDSYGSTMFDVICDMCCWTSLVDTEERAIELWNQGIVNVSIYGYKALESQNKELVEALEDCHSLIMKYRGCQCCIKVEKRIKETHNMNALPTAEGCEKANEATDKLNKEVDELLKEEVCECGGYLQCAKRGMCLECGKKIKEDEDNE